MNRRKYNWPLMVREIMDTAFLPQREMAENLNVSQQTVSNWVTGFRNPRARIIPGLLEMAENNGLDISRYETEPGLGRINECLKEDNCGEFVRIYELFSRMSSANKGKFIRHAVSISSKN
ncbi:MAG: helix-turn-helix domain-containing protein [Victivallales bacterium]